MNLLKILNFLSKKPFFIGFIIFASSLQSPLKAQSIVYYPFNSVLGISSNPNNAAWVDFRFFTNSFFTSVTTDASLEFNIADTQRAYYYLGGGAKFNIYNITQGYNAVEGYFMNGGVRVRPFDKFKRVQIAFEISPFVTRQLDAGLFRTMLGIGYNFNQRK